MSMFIILLFFLFPFFISIYHHLKLEKEIIVASIRAYIQLSILGIVLSFVFSLTSWVAIFAYILFMIIVAAHTAQKRGKEIPFSLLTSFVSIFSSWIITIPFWLLFHVIPLETSYVLAVSGMIIGNAMTSSGQTFHLLHREFQQTRDMIESKLALGFPMYHAAHEWLQQTIKTALMPNLDTLKTVGLVQMPGMMTGMILAGTSPIHAVQVQIVIMFSISAITVLSTVTVSLISYRFYFDRGIRLRK